MGTFEMLGAYLKRIFDVTKHGDAREESYYSVLEELIKNCAESSGKKKTHVTTLPKKTGHPVARFEGIGDNRMRKHRYSENEQRVYINEAQYFEGIAKEIWEYQIGGYQVMDKWLKDRKGQILSFEDIQHYCRVATALARTIQRSRPRLTACIHKSKRTPWQLNCLRRLEAPN